MNRFLRVPASLAIATLLFVACEEQPTNPPTTPGDHAGTASGAAFTQLRKVNGSNVTAFSPLDVLPTGAAMLDRSTTALTSSRPDVLQAYTETEAATAGVADVLPYGFVVTNPLNPASRFLGPSTA